MFGIDEHPEATAQILKLGILIMGEAKSPLRAVIGRPVRDYLRKIGVHMQMWLQFLPRQCLINRRAVAHEMKGILLEAHNFATLGISDPCFTNRPLLGNRPVKHFCT